MLKFLAAATATVGGIVTVFSLMTGVTFGARYFGPGETKLVRGKSRLFWPYVVWWISLAVLGGLAYVGLSLIPDST